MGSGFGGSLLAMIARRLGYSVVLLEKGTHPRMAIGESSTPLANLLLEELSARYDLPFLRPFAKWGSWQRTYPEIPCGLKRGFSFFHHELENPSPALSERSRQLLVAASPHDGVSDTHWFRADFDRRLAEEARRLGVDYFDRVLLSPPTWSGDSILLTGTRLEGPFAIRAQFLVDASGPRGFMHTALALAERPLPLMPPTQALYSHFTGVGRLESTLRYGQDHPPFPVDAAAVHHVFHEGWIWVLQFNNGVTSAGVAARDSFAERFQFADRGARAWRSLISSIPELAHQFSSAEPIYDFRHIPRLPFLSAAITGKRWAMLPSAAGFVDPLLSTGIPLTLLGIDRLAGILEAGLSSSGMARDLEEYERDTEGDLFATARLVGALYANMDNFRVFAALSLLYFAAASFTETVRRLGRPELARGFLLRSDRRFGNRLADLLEQACSRESRAASDDLCRSVSRMIEPFDVAGLSDSSRDGWYPVKAADLLRNAARVGASEEDILKMLRKAGFAPGSAARNL